ncbi:hypothetical protein DPX16_11653 [Anabarilius grahami]|uniref:Uncharacterized protein n=1 Tax=Anabarilius grahami TaxID=495550 RepID=A0A3N0Z3N0_ANAGA|nr:hypothetical protein DPX16_11653 [Anabarilius grahami]
MTSVFDRGSQRRKSEGLLILPDFMKELQSSWKAPSTTALPKTQLANVSGVDGCGLVAVPLVGPKLCWMELRQEQVEMQPDQTSAAELWMFSCVKLITHQPWQQGFLSVNDSSLQHQRVTEEQTNTAGLPQLQDGDFPDSLAPRLSPGGRKAMLFAAEWQVVGEPHQQPIEPRQLTSPQNPAHTASTVLPTPGRQPPPPSPLLQPPPPSPLLQPPPPSPLLQPPISTEPSPVPVEILITFEGMEPAAPALSEPAAPTLSESAVPLGILIIYEGMDWTPLHKPEQGQSTLF